MKNSQFWQNSKKNQIWQNFFILKIKNNRFFGLINEFYQDNIDKNNIIRLIYKILFLKSILFFIIIDIFIIIED